MREKKLAKSVGGGRWRVPDAKTYVEVAGKLLVWAVKSKSADTRSQFQFLASLYEEMVERAAGEARRAARPSKAEVARKPQRAVSPRASRGRHVEAPAA
jgi:hypothetical protein